MGGGWWFLMGRWEEGDAEMVCIFRQCGGVGSGVGLEGEMEGWDP